MKHFPLGRNNEVLWLLHWEAHLSSYPSHSFFIADFFCPRNIRIMNLISDLWDLPSREAIVKEPGPYPSDKPFLIHPLLLLLALHFEAIFRLAVKPWRHTDLHELLILLHPLDLTSDSLSELHEFLGLLAQDPWPLYGLVLLPIHVFSILVHYEEPSEILLGIECPLSPRDISK